MSRKDQPHYRRANALVAGLAVGLLSVPATAIAAPQFTVLHSFQDTHDGDMPQSALIADASGALYGTATYGGDPGYGTVYKLIPVPSSDGTWPLQVLYSFTGYSNGAYPYSGLVFNKFGVLYGAASNNSESGSWGNIFTLSPPKSDHDVWEHQVIYRFNYTHGAGPNIYGSLIFDAQGSLYGTTRAVQRS